MNPIYLLLLLPALLLPLLLAAARVLPLRLPFRMGERGTILLSLLCSLGLLGVVALHRAEKSLVCCKLRRPFARPTYKITDLGALPGGSTSIAEGINDRGEIIGVSDAVGGKYHPFLYANGKMRDLGVPADAAYGVANHINAQGVIVGDYVYDDDGDAIDRAFRYENGKVQELPVPPNTGSYYAQGINDGGQIVGYSFLTTDHVHSVLWEPHGAVVPIPGLGDADNAAFDINDAGQVVGIAGNHGYLADKNGVRSIGDLGGGLSIALSVNARSQVAGWSTLPSRFPHAFLYDSGKMRDLGTLRGGDEEYSLANAISESGDVLGLDINLEANEVVIRAFLWREGRMMDLGACCPNAGGWHIVTAAAENGGGQIVATGEKDGTYHALLLTPQ